MMIDISQWRASIGLWYCHQIPYTTKTTPSTTDTTGWVKSLLMSGDEGGGTLIFSLVLFLLLLLILSGDVELNPGPKTELTSNNALRLLVKSGFVVEEKWTKLTSFLGVSLEERRRLKKMVSNDQDHHFALEEGLQWWIINGSAPSWEELISAVKNCGNKNVATTLKRQLDIKDEGQTEGQKEGKSHQIGGQTSTSCDKSVYGDIEGTGTTECDEVCKVLKDVLTGHFADLSNQLSRCLPQISAAMYSKRLISESVRKSPAIDIVIDEFESGMRLANNISKLQEHCQLFLQCLSNEGGPTKLAAQKLCHDWIEEVKKECDISLDLICYEQEIKQQGSHYTNKAKLDLSKIANSSAGDKIEQTGKKDDKSLHFDFWSVDGQLQKITVIPDDPVAEKLNRLYNKFVKLVEDTKQALNRLIETGTHTFIDIASYLGEYFRIKGLTDTTDIHKLYEALWPHYSYLDVEVLDVIVKNILNEDFIMEKNLQRDIQTYKLHLEEFKQSTTLNKFKNAVEEALIPHPEVTSITCEVVIKLNRQWGKKTLENFKTLVNHMFHQRMTHIRVEEGSVYVTLLVPQSKLDYILEIATLKKKFASLIGIFELTIDGQAIFKEEEQRQFSFDQALQEASRLGEDEAVQFLLNLIDNINLQNEEGCTALMLASKGGHEQVVQALILAEANPNIQNNTGYTALMLACDTNSCTIVNYLLHTGANPNIQRDDGATAIIIACQNIHFEIIKLLLRFNADQFIASRNDDTALTVATRQNSIEIVEMLLEHLTENQKTSAVTSVLTIACQYGYSQTIISSLEKLFEFFTPEEFQLFISCAKGDDSTESHIYDTNVNINCTLVNDITPLMIASSCGHTETVQTLLKTGANVNSTDNYGYSPLVYAITGHKSLQVIEQLLIAGALPNIFINGQSITAKAREEGREDICKLLQQFNVVKNKKSKEEVLEQLLKICDSFTILKAAILSSLQKLITEGTVLFVDVIEFLQHDLGGIESKMNNIHQLSNAIQTHLYFLNVDLLRKIVDKFIGDKLQNHLQQYISMLKAFEETTQLQLFGQAMKHISSLQPPVTTTRTCTMFIKFHEQWQQRNVVHLHKFLNYLFPNASSILNHIIIEDEESACVCKFVVSKSQLECLIVNAVEKKEFMYQVGVYEVCIGDQLILIEDYNHSFSFKHALQSSIKAENDILTSFLMEIDVSLYVDNNIHEVARDGNIDAIKLLLKKHIDINIQDKNGLTALMLASRNGHHHVVELLLKEHADINTQKKHGGTALMVASESGHHQVVEILLKEHADINLQTKSGLTALMLASQNSHTKIVEQLLKEHANVNTQEEIGWTALMLASQNGHHQVVKLLLKEHADINHQGKDGVTALMLASQNGHHHVIEILLKEHADINHQGKDGWTALMLASQNGHHQVIELLLKEHANVNAQKVNGATALMLASQNGHHKVIELLLKLHVNINSQKENGVTALMLASQNGHYQVIELLLKENANINLQTKNGLTALMIASETGYHEVVELLLKEHADINTQEEDGWTALMLASLNGHHQVVELLLKEHADINLHGKDGVTALILASQNGHFQVIKLLLKEHDINIQKESGATALMLASQNGHHEVIELLLKEHVDTQIEDGVTALMLASYHGLTQIVELLLKKHININHQGKDGWTALMLASVNGHYQVVELLLKEYADINTQNEDGWTALMLACCYKNFKVAQSLLKSQADPHLSLHNGSTAFSLAAFGGNIDLVNMLLDKIKPTSNEIEKSVVESCYGGYPTLVTFLSNKLSHLTNDQRELLDSCIKGDLGTVVMKTLDSPDTPLILGLTPLMVASSCGHVDIVDALIHAKADVNKQESYWGLTPLFFAVRGSKSISIVEALLKNGANLNITVNNNTALDEANVLELEAISQLLTRYGGQTASQLQKIELKSSLLTPDKEKASATPFQLIAELKHSTIYKDLNTLKMKTKEKRLQLSTISSILSSLTLSIINPAHTFKDTSVKQYSKNEPKQDNKTEAKEIYVVTSN